MNPDDTGSFQSRHIGPRPHERDRMLQVIGAPSLDALMEEAIPSSIRLKAPPSALEPEREHEFLARLREVARRNLPVRSLIGLGYSDCVTPSVILRNVLENPSWYTPYTPYQAEIAQGRLEALLTFQTLVEDLTAMPVANASLLDEPTAAAEAMTMLRRVQGGSKSVFVVSSGCFPQTIDVLTCRAEPLGIELVVAEPDGMIFDERVFGVLLQTPDERGALHDLRGVIARAHAAGALVAVATDLLALVLATPPGEMGADVVIGSAQRFGVPMGYGGPHAAFFATREQYVRQAPGRIIGVSVDAQGSRAYRMALQTREQHIRRDKATSNICTAQALLATMAAMYGVYHGPDGLRSIAARIHGLARELARRLAVLGCEQRNAAYFDTLALGVPADAREGIREAALAAGYNFRFDASRPDEIGIALDEVTSASDVDAVAAVFARALKAAEPPAGPISAEAPAWPAPLARTSVFLTHPVFHRHQSETSMMRFLKALERKDVGLDTSMIPLGSCTMKLNAATIMEPVTWPEFAGVHPFAPADQAAGYAEVIDGLEAVLRDVTGFAAVSLQPNSGAQGEFAGLMVIRAWHRDRGDLHRTVVLIPSSAHGTNPASAVMAGMQVVVVACDANGNIDVADLAREGPRARGHAGRPHDHLPVHARRLRGRGAGDLPHRARARRAGLHGRREPQRPTRPDEPRRDRGRCLPSQPAQDVRDPAWRRRPGHGTHRRGAAPGAVPAGARPRAHRGREGDPRRRRRAFRIGEHPAHLVCVRVAPGRRGHDRRHEVRHPERQLHRGAAQAVLPGPLHQRPRALRPRDDLRPARVQGGGRRGRRRGQAAHGLRLPRADGLVSRAGHAHGRTHRERTARRTGSVLRRDDRDPPGDPGRRRRQGRSEGQPAQERAAHGGGRDRRHLDAPYSREQAVFPLPFVKQNKFWPSVGRIDNPYGDRHLVCACPPIEEYGEPDRA